MQCCNTDVTVGCESGERLTSLPIPRLPHPDVSSGLPERFMTCTESVKRFLPAYVMSESIFPLFDRDLSLETCLEGSTL